MGGEGAQETAKQRSPPPRDPVPPPKRPRPAPPPPAPARTQPQVYRPQEQREEEVQEVQEVQTVKAEPREQQSYQENHESAVALEDGYQEEYGDYAQYEGQYDAIDPNTGLPLADGNKGYYQETGGHDILNKNLIERFSTAWRCTVCKKMCSSQKMAQAYLKEVHHVTKQRSFY